MLVSQVKSLTPYARLVYWITEREAIRIKKEKEKPKPWTDDEILQSYRFCNVRRMDDKVSKWLYENWYKPNQGHPNIIPAVALARFVNKIETLNQITTIVWQKKWDAECVANALRSIRSERGTVFGAAYVVRGNDGMDKIASVVDYYVEAIREGSERSRRSLRLLNIYKGEDLSVSMKDLHAEINGLYGYGSFMAGQVVADLRWAIPANWTDKDTWAPMGPGSKRGMNRIHNRDLNETINQKQFIAQLRTLVKNLNKDLPKSISSRLEMIDYQSCLCEIDKYDRVLFLYGGRPKQRYSGKV